MLTLHVLTSLITLCSYYAELAGPENAARYQTVLFLAGSASAEFFADIALCPFEAVKVISYVFSIFMASLTEQHVVSH